MSDSFYNEFSAFPAQWLNNLIKKQLIHYGYVDERSISEVSVHDLEGFQQCHFFAGVGGWPIALREAGWPEGVPVWSGSCPCQPFSAAGLGKGTSDDRHLWPEFFRLIKARRPLNIFGEQVSGRKVTGKLFTPRGWKRLEPEDRRTAEEADSEAWFRHVQTDLEGIGYIVGHCVFPAASIGAPHARQRLYWYARYVGDDTSRGRREEQPIPGGMREGVTAAENEAGGSGPSCTIDELADMHEDRWTKTGNCYPETGSYGIERNGTIGGVADMHEAGLGTPPEERPGKDRSGETDDVTSCCGSNRPGPTNGFWGTVDWLFCRDNKWRPVEPGSSPLAYGLSFRASKIRAGLAFLGYGTKAFQRVIRKSKEILQEARGSRNGQLSGYGNAIAIDQAVEFIRACMKEIKGG